MSRVDGFSGLSLPLGSERERGAGRCCLGEAGGEVLRSPDISRPNMDPRVLAILPVNNVSKSFNSIEMFGGEYMEWVMYLA